MIRPTARRSQTSESGASAVEFALVVPVLLAFIYGIIAFGFVFSQQISLNNAARDASRAGVVLPLATPAMTCQQIADRVRTGMNTTVGVSNANLTTVAITVTGPAGACTMGSGSTAVSSNGTLTPCTGAGATSNLTVAASYQSVTPVPLPVINNINLKSSGVFACEYK